MDKKLAKSYVCERNERRERNGRLATRPSQVGENLSKRAAAPAINQDSCLALNVGGAHQHHTSRHHVRRRGVGVIIKLALKVKAFFGLHRKFSKRFSN